ncbi:MAG TPA: phosphoribosylformylglycinamidine synthase subunit PurL, partial [Bacteroidetes bacterium]|nr:phosphoribosylformylglycinamidine synthase subunit PurL [Bacteroidota bacterium]
VSTNLPSDAAIVRIKGSNKALSMTVDCNPYYVFSNPEQGTAIAVSEAARNIVCSGGKPLAITNCLNFGNPYNKEVYWQFVHAIKGMSKACEKFQTPVTGGNVSFYNQSSDEGPVFPSPTIGMVGILDNVNNAMGIAFNEPENIIYMIGESMNDIGSSQYLIHIKKTPYSPAPHLDLEKEDKLHKSVSGLIKNKVILSAHDISDGGLIVSLIESAIINKLGFSIDTDPEFRKDAFLFGETQSRVIVSVSKDNALNLEDILNSQQQAYRKLGNVTKGSVSIDNENWGEISGLKTIYESSIEDHLD